jgi:hypothetical protein
MEASKGKVRQLNLFMAVGLAFCASCSTMEVVSQKSPGADLKHFKSYSFLSDGTSRRRIDPALSRNVQDSLDQSLQQNGFIKPPEGGAPDFWVKYSVASQPKQVVIPGAASGGPYWSGYTAMPPTVQTYREGSLIVEFIDTRSKKPFWQGVAEAEISDPSEVPEQVQQAARKIVKEYRSDEEATKRS